MLERIERVRILSSRCPKRGGCSGSDDGDGDGCVCSAEAPRSGFRGSLLPALLACAFIAYRGRRRSR